MADVKLKVNSPILADYLAWLFPPEAEDGPLRVTATNSLGRLLVAHCHIEEDPGKRERVDAVSGAGGVTLTLDLPNDTATKPLLGKWLWYPPADTAALNMALRAVFDIDFDRYYLEGLERGHMKKDIVTAFIVSRGLFSSDGFDALHKRAYRRSLATLDTRVKQLLRKAYYIDSTINIKGLEK